MNIEGISLNRDISLKRESFSEKEKTEQGAMVVEGDRIEFSFKEKITVSFSFLQKVEKESLTSEDDLLETLKEMSLELAKIARQKGRKRIIVEFSDLESARKIITFNKGDFFIRFLCAAQTLALRDEILYREDPKADLYAVEGRVNTKLGRIREEQWITQRGDLTMTIEEVLKGESLKLNRVYSPSKA